MRFYVPFMIFFVLVFSIFVAAAEIDIAVPSFPEMQQVFALSPFMVEFVLGANLLAHCISALIVGNLGDKYGKKRVINYGFIVFIIGSLICALAGNFAVLIFGRVLQGVGVAPAMVLSFIIAIERYKREDQEKAMGTLNGICTLSICLAPTIGSYISIYFGWRGNFWLLFGLGVVAFVFFEAVIPPDRKNDKAVRLGIGEYFKLLKNKLVAIYATTLCLTIGAYYTFVGIAPILYMEALGVSLKHFGFYQGALTLTFGVFSLVSGRVMKAFGKKRCFYASLFLVVLFVLLSLAVMVSGVQSPIKITAIMLILSVGFVIPCNILCILMLEIMPNAKGKLSALIATLKWVFAVGGLQTASYFYSGSYNAIGGVMVTMVVLSLIFGTIIWLKDGRLKVTINQFA